MIATRTAWLELVVATAVSFIGFHLLADALGSVRGEAGLVGELSMYEGWPLLVPGLFAQGGIAEELLFRGFLYGHIRRGRTFWRAVALATPPFVAAHLFMFLTFPWPIALASTALAAIISIPMARLYELGGGTIWAPAVLHVVVQGAIKVTVIDGRAGEALPMVWLGASAALPFLVFVVRPDEDRGR